MHDLYRDEYRKERSKRSGAQTLANTRKNGANASGRLDIYICLLKTPRRGFFRAFSRGRPRGASPHYLEGVRKGPAAEAERDASGMQWAE